MIAVAPPFQPVCEDYAIACAVPVDAPGWETYIGPCWVDQVQRQNFETFYIKLDNQTKHQICNYLNPIKSLTTIQVLPTSMVDRVAICVPWNQAPPEHDLRTVILMHHLVVDVSTYHFVGITGRIRCLDQQIEIWSLKLSVFHCHVIQEILIKATQSLVDRPCCHIFFHCKIAWVSLEDGDFPYFPWFCINPAMDPWILTELLPGITWKFIVSAHAIFTSI